MVTPRRQHLGQDPDRTARLEDRAVVPAGQACHRHRVLALLVRTRLEVPRVGVALVHLVEVLAVRSRSSRTVRSDGRTLRTGARTVAAPLRGSSGAPSRSGPSGRVCETNAPVAHRLRAAVRRSKSNRRQSAHGKSDCPGIRPMPGPDQVPQELGPDRFGHAQGPRRRRRRGPGCPSCHHGARQRSPGRTLARSEATRWSRFRAI